jgi:hypothetical protein
MSSLLCILALPKSRKGQSFDGERILRTSWTIEPIPALEVIEFLKNRPIMPNLTPAELKEQILHRLKETNQKEQMPALAEGIAGEMLDALYPTLDAKRRVDADVFKSNTYYAIPDDALDLIPALAKAAFAVISGEPSHALPELVGILYRYRKLQVVLDGDEAAVVRVLRTAHKAKRDPLSPAEIRGQLNYSKLHLQRPLNEVLSGLDAKKTEKTILATESNGRWTIGNV